MPECRVAGSHGQSGNAYAKDGGGQAADNESGESVLSHRAAYFFHSWGVAGRPVVVGPTSCPSTTPRSGCQVQRIPTISGICKIDGVLPMRGSRFGQTPSAKQWLNCGRHLLVACGGSRSAPASW